MGSFYFYGEKDFSMNTNTKGKEYELIVRICEYDFVRTHLHIFIQICMYLYAICTHLNAIARICA